MKNHKNQNPKLFVLKKVLKYAFIVSGFVPANYLLFYAVFLLGPLVFDESVEIKYDLKTILFYGSVIIGSFGYLGLFLSMIPIPESRIFLGIRILFLSLGITGFCIFSSQGDKGFDGFWELVFAHIFSLDWFLYCWPNVVALVLIFYDVSKLIKLRSSSPNSKNVD